MFYLLEDSITPFLEEFYLEYDKNLVKIATDVSKIKIRKNEIFEFFCFMAPELRTTNLKLHYYDSLKN